MFRGGGLMDTLMRRCDNDVVPGRPIHVVNGQMRHAGGAATIRVDRLVKTLPADGRVVIRADDVLR